MKVRAYTSGVNAPSARFRLRQFLRQFEEAGVYVDEDPRGGYRGLQGAWTRRLFAVSVDALRRSAGMIGQGRYDLGFFQKPHVIRDLTVERFWRGPMVFDVDDAIHLMAPQGGAARKLALRADCVIVGNRVLAEYYGDFAKRVEIVPTAVDTDVYRPAERVEERETINIGWVGTKGNLVYLEKLSESLGNVARMDPRVRILVVSDARPRLRGVPREALWYWPWTPEREVAALRAMDIGVMPLRDGEWERAKCSFKMLLYLAAGIPVVVSPVGMNGDVLREAAVGFGATVRSEWEEALGVLMREPNLRRELGENGRRLVLERYSVNEIAQRLISIMKGVSGR